MDAATARARRDAREHHDFTQRQQDRVDKSASDEKAKAKDRAKLWGTSLVDIFQGLAPTWFHQVTVTVQGGPEADMRRIWLLAVSAAAGRMARNGRGTSALRSAKGAAFTAHYDVSNKTVVFTFAYSISGFVSYLAFEILDGDGPAGAYLQRGVDQLTVGASSAELNITGLPVVPGGLGAVIGARAIGLLSTPKAIAPPTTGLALTVLGSLERGAGVSLSLRTAPTDTFPNAARERRLTDLDGRPVFLARAVGGPSDPSGDTPFANRSTYKIPADGPITGASFPDVGRIITTGEKNDTAVQPPAPQADGFSRVHPLISLVAPLMQPGFSAVPPRRATSNMQPLVSPGATFPRGVPGPGPVYPAVASNIEGG